MLTRRQTLSSAAVLTGAILTRSAMLAKASQPATPVRFAVPPHACDCHTHIFGDPAEFPLFSGRSYTPEPASPVEMAALHRALHIERVVIVTPSVYGADNAATLYGLKARGATARGVAVIDEKTSDRELSDMARAGVRGIRLNLATGGVTDPAEARRRFDQAAARVKDLGWHIQIYTTLPVISSIKDAVGASPVPVVFDHFGGARTKAGAVPSGFPELVDLVRSGKAYVKISGAYRASSRGPDFPDVTPLAQELIGANASRILWGTDWPHPNTATRGVPSLPIDDGRLLNQLPVWAPSEQVRKQILVANPARLYGF